MKSILQNSSLPSYLVLEEILEQVTESVSIGKLVGGESQLVFVNTAFTNLTGYSLDEIIGKDCRFLQGKESNSDDAVLIRKAIDAGQPITITLKNYRKNGKEFWNELSLSPIYTASPSPLYYLGIQRDVTKRIERELQVNSKMSSLEESRQSLEGIAQSDELSGLKNKRYFMLQFPLQINNAKRHGLSISLFFMDIDYFKQYNDTYGHVAGDECIQRVGKCVADNFRRDSDTNCRFGGEEFVVVTLGDDLDCSLMLGNRLLDSIRALKLPHILNPHKVVTASVGILHVNSGFSLPMGRFIAEADQLMYQAKSQGRNSLVHREYSGKD